jgi:hypothetical protein
MSVRCEELMTWDQVLMHGRSYTSEGNIAAATIAAEADSVGKLWELLAEKVIE